MVVAEVPVSPLIESNDIIGADIVIENIAADFTGKYHSGDEIK